MDSTVRSQPRRAGRDVDGSDSTRLDDAEEDPRACHVSRAERDASGSLRARRAGRGAHRIDALGLGIRPSARAPPVVMIFNLEGLTVYFPYEYIYPEQYKYMLELKHGLDARGHGCLEMPTGTGKTITCLALITSYQLAHPECGKLIYCTRTVPEMEKVLAELRVLRYREKHVGKAAEIMALGLSSRKNMCIPPSRRGRGQPRERRRAMPPTHSHVGRERHMEAVAQEETPETDLCQFFEDYEKEGPDAVLPPGCTPWRISRLQEEGLVSVLPLARHMIAYANVVVYNYQYLLDLR